MNRKQAVAVLRELGEAHLVLPSLVIIEQRAPDRYQLKIKGNYDFELIELFIQKNNLAAKQDKDKGYLLIFKP
jgi:hypothetical protein